MSIWCSQPPIGYDAWHTRGRSTGGEVRSYATGFSNHYPTTTGQYERRASVDTATIAPWCVPGQHALADEHLLPLGLCGPWLRLSLDTHEHDVGKPHRTLGLKYASVVMDEAAVEALRDELTEWLEQPKVHPA